MACVDGSEKRRLPGWEGSQCKSFRSCPICEETADGVSVGRCWLRLEEGKTCPRHGDVSEAVSTYMRTGELTPESELVRTHRAELVTEVVRKEIREGAEAATRFWVWSVVAAFVGVVLLLLAALFSS